jgi:NADH:ubiquinone oxidoreductase subunit 3 (subunit A)
MSFGVTFPLIAVFALSFAIVLVIFWAGGRVAVKGATKADGKAEPYACGEDMPAEESRVDLERFLVFAVNFLIFDILAFVLATSFYTTGLMPVAYISIVLIAVAVLMYSRRRL